MAIRPRAFLKDTALARKSPRLNRRASSCPPFRPRRCWARTWPAVSTGRTMPRPAKHVGMRHRPGLRDGLGLVSQHHSPVLDRAAFDLRWRRSPALRSTSMDRNRAQLCLESSVNEIVVSCDRRDHRRKSSANMMPTSPQKGFLQCSGCRSPMRLLSTLPALGRFPAQQIYVCAPCHRVQAVEHAVVASSMLNEGMAT